MRSKALPLSTGKEPLSTAREPAHLAGRGGLARCSYAGRLGRLGCGPRAGGRLCDGLRDSCPARQQQWGSTLGQARSAQMAVHWLPAGSAEGHTASWTELSHASLGHHPLTAHLPLRLLLLTAVLQNWLGRGHGMCTAWPGRLLAASLAAVPRCCSSAEAGIMLGCGLETTLLHPSNICDQTPSEAAACWSLGA